MRVRAMASAAFEPAAPIPAPAEAAPAPDATDGSATPERVRADSPLLIPPLRSAVAADRADLNGGISSGESALTRSGVAEPSVASGAGAASAGAGMGAAGSNAAEAMALTRIAAHYAALRSAMDRQQARELLTAIRAIALGVKHIEGRKSLVLFSQGVVISQLLWPDLNSVVDAANRAQLAIYSIDARGMETHTLSGALVQRDELTAAIGPSENER